MNLLPQSVALAAALSVLGSGSALAGPHGVAAPPSPHAAAASTMSRDASATPSTTLRGPTLTGQPNKTCGTPGALNTPGAAASAPGSAFNPDGKAGSVYAGEQPQNSRNTASVAQYDVACSHQK